MKIGILEESKTPPDERVPFTPEQCKQIQEQYQAELWVQKSKVRRIKDEEYEAAELNAKEDISDCDVFFGVKEVALDRLLENKTYFFFSHTIKKQPYNQKLLRTVIDKKIRLIDYECLVNEQNMRLIGFGRFAGLVGAYNGFRMMGLKRTRYVLERAIECKDLDDMMNELSKVTDLPVKKICITGRGRVAGGALEIMQKLGIREVSVDEFLNEKFKEPVYVQLAVTDYNKRKDGEQGSIQDFFNHPELYESNFSRFANVAEYYIACHYWDSKAPYILTKEDLRHPDFKIDYIADISCDINGPIATTLRPSTIDDPYYGVWYKDCSERNHYSLEAISVMAVDNLPCELPIDASRDFGKQLLEFVIPSLFNGDKDQILKRATIADNGELTERFEYLRDYLEGN